MLAMKEHPRRYAELDPHVLVPYADNPRVNDDAVQFVANSIEDYSFNDPIEVNEDMVVLSGHTRLKAALALGMETVPVIVISGMTETEQKAYRIAANKTQEKAGWDFDKLDRQVDELLDLKVDVERFGLSLAYLTDRVVPEPEPLPEMPVPLPETPKAASVPRPTRDFRREVQVEPGDVVVCGRHRLYCGDASSDESYGRLLDGAVCDMTFTSPPYNVGKFNDWKPWHENKYVHSDDVSEEDFELLVMTVLDKCLVHSHEVLMNIGLLSSTKPIIARLLHDRLAVWKDILYWEKTNAQPSVVDGLVSSSVEPVLAFGRNGSRSFRKKDMELFHGVVSGPNVCANPYSEVHRAIFPEYLPTEFLTRLTDEGAFVLDPFIGTGTTMLACESTGRTCYGMDIEPLYIQIAADRWSDRANKDPYIVRNGEAVAWRR